MKEGLSKRRWCSCGEGEDKEEFTAQVKVSAQVRFWTRGFRWLNNNNNNIFLISSPP